MSRPFLSSISIALLLVCTLLSGDALAVTKKKPVKKLTKVVAGRHAFVSSKSGSKSVHGKKSSKAAKRGSSKNPGPAFERFVPVPQARAVIPQAQQEAADPEVAVPAPDMAAEQQTQSSARSFSTASPEAASALSVDDRLVHGGSALHFAGALSGFFDALQAHGGPQGASTVRVLQFGDSHTAADMFSGEMRSQMQGSFGDGSVGFTYAGHPFPGYRILGSGRGESAGWTTLGTHFTQLGDGLLGLGGVAIETQSAGASTSLSVNCTTLDVQYLRRVGGGSFVVRDNGTAMQSVSTNSDAAAGTVASANDVQAAKQGDAGVTTLTCQPGRNEFTFTANGDGPVRLLGTVSLQPGITWEAAGINGSEAPLLLRWNRPMFDSYLSARAPQMIVLAYGTNEAAARWTREEYQQTFSTLIAHLHTVAPLASILVIGPGDRAIAKSFATPGRRGRAVTRRGYVPFAGTARIIGAMRDVCRAENCAYWDWSERQGGLGAMQRWVAAGYAQPDHTHLTGTGYRALADALYADLKSSYDAYVRRKMLKN